jgi:hypothetical protein
MYSLWRSSDGFGDSGGMSLAIKFRDEDEKPEVLIDSRPLVGYHMRVGSTYARSFQYQDYVTTTPVIEIVSDEPTKVVFKTLSGSEYTWRTDRE